MQTFRKKERLSNKRDIDELFKHGKSIQHQAFKLKLIEVEASNVPIQLLISVPKKLFKNAVDRNKIKRWIREVYRKSKESIIKHLGIKKIQLMLIYSSKVMPSYKEIEKQLMAVLTKLKSNI